MSNLANKALNHFYECAVNNDMNAYCKIECILRGRKFYDLAPSELQTIIDIKIKETTLVEENEFKPHRNIDPIGKKSIYLERSEQNKQLSVNCVVEFIPHIRTNIKTPIKGKIQKIYKSHKDNFNEYVEIICIEPEFKGRIFNKKINAVTIVNC